eukprot:4756572-Amphidinium_carterae.1
MWVSSYDSVKGARWLGDVMMSASQLRCSSHTMLPTPWPRTDAWPINCHEHLFYKTTLMPADSQWAETLWINAPEPTDYSGSKHWHTVAHHCVASCAHFLS